MFAMINGKEVEGSSLSVIKANARRLGRGVVKVYSGTPEKLFKSRVRGSTSWSYKGKRSKAEKAIVISNPVTAVFKV